MLPIENNGLITKAKLFLSFKALAMGQKKPARLAGGAEAFSAQCIVCRC